MLHRDRDDGVRLLDPALRQPVALGPHHDSHLVGDARRRERLAEIVSEAQQVFVTAAVGDDLPEKLAGARFWVHDGVVERIEESAGVTAGRAADKEGLGDEPVVTGEVRPGVNDVDTRGEDDG